MSAQNAKIKLIQTVQCQVAMSALGKKKYLWHLRQQNILNESIPIKLLNVPKYSFNTDEKQFDHYIEREQTVLSFTYWFIKMGIVWFSVRDSFLSNENFKYENDTDLSVYNPATSTAWLNVVLCLRGFLANERVLSIYTQFMEQKHISCVISNSFDRRHKIIAPKQCSVVLEIWACFSGIAIGIIH